MKRLLPLLFLALMLTTLHARCRSRKMPRRTPAQAHLAGLLAGLGYEVLDHHLPMAPPSPRQPS